MILIAPVLQETAPAISPWFQWGVAGLFAVFTIYLSMLHAKERRESNELWREFLRGEAKHRDELDEKWRLMLEAQATQRKELMTTAYTSYFDRIHEMAESVIKVAEALASHDTNAQVRQEQVLAAVEQLRESLQWRGS